MVQGREATALTLTSTKSTAPRPRPDKQQACHSCPAHAFLFPTWHAGAKSGLTAYRTASTNGCPKRAAGPTTLRLKYDPATPRDGAKGFRTQLTPLQLRDSGRRGWPDGPQRVTAEEEDRGIAPWPPAYGRGMRGPGNYREVRKRKF